MPHFPFSENGEKIPLCDALHHQGDDLPPDVSVTDVGVHHLEVQGSYGSGYCGSGAVDSVETASSFCCCQLMQCL